jgi:hypothetical protein
LFGPKSVFDVIEGEEEVGPVLRVDVLAHVFVEDGAEFLTDGFDDCEIDVGGSDGGESNEENGEGGALPVVFVVVADDVCSS